MAIGIGDTRPPHAGWSGLRDFCSVVINCSDAKCEGLELIRPISLLYKHLVWVSKSGTVV